MLALETLGEVRTSKSSCQASRPEASLTHTTPEWLILYRCYVLQHEANALPRYDMWAPCGCSERSHSAGLVLATDGSDIMLFLMLSLADMWI
jgi:hypothetical protein